MNQSLARVKAEFVFPAFFLKALPQIVTGGLLPVILYKIFQRERIMFFRIVRKIAWVLAHILYRFEVSGMENIPKEGNFLLCANHISALDPIMLAIFMKRQPRFMGKKELFRFWIVDKFLRALGAFPVDRAAADLAAYRTSMEVLKRGHGLIIFSQGTRMKDFEGAKGGVAMFALKSGAPIVPAGINGPFKFRRKITIRVGEPIFMEPYAGRKVKTDLIEELMGIVVGKVENLLDN